MAQLDGEHERLVQGEEHRDLDDHRQAPPQRVDLVVAVQLHDSLVHGVAVVLVLLADLVHLRLDLLHPLHGLVALVGQREEQRLEDDGDDDDGNAVVTHIAIEELEGIEQRFGDGREPAQVKGLLQGIALGLEDVDILGADEQALRHRGRLSRVDGELRGRYGRLHEPGSVLFQFNGGDTPLLGQNGAQEVFIGKARPEDVPVVFLRRGGNILGLVGLEAVVVIDVRPGGIETAFLYLVLGRVGHHLLDGSHQGGRGVVEYLGIQLDAIGAAGEGVDLAHGKALARDVIERQLPAFAGAKLNLAGVRQKDGAVRKVDPGRPGREAEKGGIGVHPEHNRTGCGCILLAVILEGHALETPAAGREYRRVETRVHGHVLCGPGALWQAAKRFGGRKQRRVTGGGRRCSGGSRVLNGFWRKLLFFRAKDHGISVENRYRKNDCQKCALFHKSSSCAL